MRSKVCVLGAGIVGLSTAIRLQQVLGSNTQVTIIADKFGKETTSNKAAGIFRPENVPLVSGYTGRRSTVGQDIVLISYQWYKSILESSKAEQAGIHHMTGYDVRYPGIGKEPFYAEFMQKFHSLTALEFARIFPSLPPGCQGKFLETFVVSPHTYMSWMVSRFKEAGGVIIKAHITRFDELWNDYDIVINCTGLGAARLTGDDTIVPSRGQVMRVDNSNSKNTFIYINNGTAKMPYYIWTPDYTVIGGTKLIGNYDSRISRDDHNKMLKDCQTYFPWLHVTEDQIVDEVVGFRPSRPAIRLEAESICFNGVNKWVVHNYGHCSNGISHSWGCGHIAVELVLDILNKSKL